MASQTTSATALCMEALRRYPSDVIRDLASDDPMARFPEGWDRASAYEIHGKVMLDSIRMAMVAAHKDTAHSILDLPSGYGRVLRFLKAEFPEARLAACDIDHRAVDFCAETFGATPVYGQEHPRDIELEGGYDLIWVGSLFTHLDKPMWQEFLDFFQSVLAPRGVLIFSVSGRYIASIVREPEAAVRWTGDLENDEKREALLAGYETGFGFLDYATQDPMHYSHSATRYGVSLVKPSWVCQLLERQEHLQMTSYTEGRWGSMDIVGCVHVSRIAVEESAVRHTLGPS